MTDRYIVTNSGEAVSLNYGRPSVMDIALSHCRTPMFAGQTDFPYSVAHHCVSAAEIALASDLSMPKSVPLYTLLHEVETAVFGDVPGPVKCSEQRYCERLLRDRVYEGLGINLPGDVWCFVEIFGKVEQAASVQFLGLREPVHVAAWNSIRDPARAIAKQITVRNYQRFPPTENLAIDCPLMRHFLKLFDDLISTGRP